MRHPMAKPASKAQRPTNAQENTSRGQSRAIKREMTDKNRSDKTFGFGS
jgi:hypothetical protein